MIIIEGPDGAGKSTLVNYIRDLDCLGVIKPYYPKKNQHSYYLHSGSLYQGYFLERYYLSEVVYPRFKLNRDPMEDWKQYQIEASLLQYAPVILYVRPPRETIIENIKFRGDEYISEDEVDRMIVEYDAAIDRSHIPVVTFDFTIDDMDEKVREAIEIHTKNLEIAQHMDQFLGAGNIYETEGLMFIGQAPSDKSVGEGYIRAFISHRGSSAFLHESLTDAGIYDEEMPYFTNWDKGFDNDIDQMRALEEEIKIIEPRKIICLGNEVRDKTGIGGGTIEHPAYVKRFHSKNYGFYIDKIKQIANED